MQVVLILMEEIIELFLILLMGFAIVKSGKLQQKDSKAVSVILVYLIVPCVIINAFQIDDTPHVREGLLFALFIAVAAHFLFILFTALLRPVLKLDTIEQLTCIYTNAGILVVPLIEVLLGDEYVVYSCAFIVVQLILLWTHCRQKLCKTEQFSWLNLLMNINILSIILGAALFFFHIHIPELLGNTLDLMGGMVGPVGMLLAGMVIADTPLAEVFARPRNYVAVLLRLFCYPLILLVLFRIFSVAAFIEDGKNILLTVYLACITPACATVTSMAQLYRANAARASLLYVLTTTCSLLSMPLMIELYELWI